MRRMLTKLAWLPVLAVGLVVAACSDQAPRSDLVAPEGPSYSRSIDKDYQALKEGRPIDYAGWAEKVIGPEGGYVYVDLHYLYVPKGAVRRPTVFRVEMLGEGQIGAKLTATRQGSKRENDVGAAGFRTPVFLFFNYSHAGELTGDPEDLRIGQLLDSGHIRWVPTRVFEEYQVAYGQLEHFSRYALAWP